MSPLTRNITILGLSLVLVTVTHVARLSTRAGEPASDTQNPYMDLIHNSDPVGDVTSAYTKKVNKLFNERIHEVVSLGSDAKEPKDGQKSSLDTLLDLVQPPREVRGPDGLATKREPCDKKDQYRLSTYCLSQQLIDEYFMYREAMMEVKKNIKDTVTQRYERLSDGRKKENAPDAVFEQNWILQAGDKDGSKTVQDYGQTINAIDIDLNTARLAMDQALAAYNELQMALPIHMKYKQAIKRLEEYRDALASVRRTVDLYPVTFLDVTTTQCN